MAENTLRCAACGAENSFDNKFCGNCGRSLLAVPAPPDAGRAMPQPPRADRPGFTRGEAPVRSAPEGAGAAPTRYTAPESTSDQATFPADEPSVPAPAYTGGLFRIREVENDQPSRNLDYLLEDDEPKSYRGWFVGLTIIALLLAGGLGYLRFRNDGLTGILGSIKPASRPANTEASSSTESTAAPSAPTSGDSGTTSGAPPAGQAPAASPATATVTAAPVTQSKALTEVRPKNPAGSDSEAALAPPAAPKTEPAPAAPRAETQPAPTPKPAPPPKPAPKPVDPVASGEKYIYGRGVPQDCARGLKAVRPAADQGNVSAMITMGALYATGHCISMDLPTAYRFFALALRKDPDNAALKQNVEMVWSKMTQSERQQAIRLTQ